MERPKACGEHPIRYTAPTIIRVPLNIKCILYDLVYFMGLGISLLQIQVYCCIAVHTTDTVLCKNHKWVLCVFMCIHKVIDDDGVFILKTSCWKMLQIKVVLTRCMQTNQLIFVMVMDCVLFEVGTECSGCHDIRTFILMKVLAHLPCLFIREHQMLAFTKWKSGGSNRMNVPKLLHYAYIC
jgi:hypothetical protein